MYVFLCQQSIEKLLKRYLLAQSGIDIPRTHDLHVLNNLCRKYDESFCLIDNECTDLNSFAVETRYPNELIFDKNKALKALRDTKKIHLFTLIASLYLKLKSDYEKNCIASTISATTSFKVNDSHYDGENIRNDKINNYKGKTRKTKPTFRPK